MKGTLNEEESESLTYLILKNDLPGVQEFFNEERNFPIDIKVVQPNSTKYTPLHLAIIHNQLDIISYLLKKGASTKVSVEDAEKEDMNVPALHLACCSSNTEIVDTLITNGADIEAEDKFGRTPLVIAVSRDLSMVRFLVEKGARLNHHTIKKAGQSSLSGYSPIHVACRESIDTLRFFIERGADMEVQSPIENADNVDETGSALLYALSINNDAAAKLLIDSGADTNAKTSTGRMMFDFEAPSDKPDEAQAEVVSTETIEEYTAPKSQPTATSEPKNQFYEGVLGGVESIRQKLGHAATTPPVFVEPQPDSKTNDFYEAILAKTEKCLIM